MKKISVFLSVLLTTVVLLCGCKTNLELSSNLTCEDILNAAVLATDAPEFEHKYIKSENNLDAFAMSLWSDGLYAESEDLVLLNDYAIYVAAGTTTYEVAVLKAKSPNDIEKLLSIVEKRKKTISQGDKGMYDPNFSIRIENSVIKADGNFVIFLLTDNNDAAIDAIDALKIK